VTPAAIIRLALAVAACTTVLIVTALSDDIFFSDFVAHESIETISPSGEVEVIGDAHFYRVPSTLEVVLRVAVPLLALFGVATYAASLSAGRKVWASISASVGAVLVSFIVVDVMARTLGVGYIPTAKTVAIWSGVSLSLGGAAAWGAARWPNKSLERTRER
jgi:hypothetical protein